MSNGLSKIIEQADTAQKLLITGSIQYRSKDKAEAREYQKHLTLEFIKAAKSEAVNEKLSTSLIEKLDKMEASYNKLPVSDRELSFKCVASYKACKADAASLEDKVLCGIALAICFAKEVIPLA